MKVAVLGTGSIGTRHLNALRTLQGVVPVAIPLRAERRVELAQAGYSIAEDLEAAAEQGATVVVIATDTRRHLADSQEALRLGYSLLVEKPSAANSAQANVLMSDAAHAKRLVVVGCTLRFSKSLNGFRALLPRLGRIHSARIECQSYLPDWRPDRPYRDSYSAQADEGGVLRDLIHEIDYASWLFGWPKSVQARVRNLGRLEIEADECADLFWETEGGTAVSIRLDYLSRPTRRRMCANGELGALEWDAVVNQVIFAPAQGDAQKTTFDQTRHQMIAEQLRAFIVACAGKVDERLATAKDGLFALAVCDAARLASESRRDVGVDYYGLC